MSALRKHKVLVVDEISYTRLMLDYTLTSAGYKVSTARNNSEAMQSVSNELPDLILYSVRSGDSDNTRPLKVLKDYFRLRKDIAQSAEPPIVILGELKEEESSIDSDSQPLEIAANIPKPINMQGLLETVKEIISNRRKTVLQIRKRIAILDDEARSQQFLQSILVHDMYDIETFISEKELLKRHRHKVFNLYIIDLPSAGKKLVDIIQNIKELSEDAVFLTITPDDYEVSQKDMDKQYIHANYTKPIDINNFRTDIDSLLEEANKDKQIETEQEEPREAQEDESKDSQVDINDESEEAVEVNNG